MRYTKVFELQAHANRWLVSAVVAELGAWAVAAAGGGGRAGGVGGAGGVIETAMLR